MGGSNESVNNLLDLRNGAVTRGTKRLEAEGEEVDGGAEKGRAAKEQMRRRSPVGIAAANYSKQLIIIRSHARGFLRPIIFTPLDT